MIITIIATIIPNEDPEDPDEVGALPEETLVELFELVFETPVVFVVFVVLTAVVFVVFVVLTAVVFVAVVFDEVELRRVELTTAV